LVIAMGNGFVFSADSYVGQVTQRNAGQASMWQAVLVVMTCGTALHQMPKAEGGCSEAEKHREDGRAAEMKAAN
jgi:hypothetical protein